MKKFSIFNFQFSRAKNWLLVIIVLFAAVLRFYQLGSNPPSLDWDEASLGYNAYSLLETGKDEYGVSWPLAIRSFGDYKPPLYTYLTIPTIALFGLTEFAVRFPSALFGTFAVFITYLLVKELIGDDRENEGNQRETVALLAAALLAISPWHLQFSRVAFEANIGLTLFILGTWLFFKGLKKGLFLTFSAVSFALSLYAYHSPRLVAPVFLFGLAVLFRKALFRRKKSVFVAIIVGSILIAPLIFVMFQGGQARFQSVTTLTPQGTLDQSIKLLEDDTKRGDYLGMIFHNRRVVYALTMMKGYLDHFDPNFLFLLGDGPARHHATGMGMLYVVEAPFVVLGIYLLIHRKKRWSIPIFLWFLVAPLASSITSGTPHAVRALLYLPTFQIFTAFGVYEFYQWTVATRTRKRFSTLLPQYQRRYMVLLNSIKVGIPVLFLFNALYYFNLYYVHTPVEHAKQWQYGYKQAVEDIQKYENEVEHIIITYVYDQPYIYFLFYEPVNPAWYQKNWGSGEIQRAKRQFGKYEFRDIKWEKDKNLQNTILVGTPGEIPKDASGTISEIKFPNGEIAFRIVRL